GGKDRLQAVAADVGVRDRVDFLGSVAHHELPYFYSAADVCVMPSYSESFGLVGLEAQASGRPVVGSDVSGLRSVIRDQVSGYLIAGHDPAEYAERIGRLLEDPELAQQMGRRGRLLAQRYSWTRTADRLRELFEDGSKDKMGGVGQPDRRRNLAGGQGRGRCGACEAAHAEAGRCGVTPQVRDPVARRRP